MRRPMPVLLSAISCVLTLIAMGCATTPAGSPELPIEAPPAVEHPEPVQGPAPIPVPKEDPKVPALAWKNSAWDEILLARIRATGLHQTPIKDAGELCPAYSILTEPQRLHFWGTLMVAMAKRESNYKPATTYQENFKNSKGEPVISTGLFQISYESAGQSAYGCGKQTTEGLKDPKTNINCSGNIVAHWVKKDGYALGKSGANVGCGRYWSVCRMSSSSRAYIVSQVNALPFCKAP